MPSRNIIKQYQESSYYHIYNRGVNKRKIFLDDQDYLVFLNRLSEALSPVEKPILFQPQLRRVKSYFGKIQLISYCLMPNHFHLLVKQVGLMDMSEFIQSICTSYVMYFNKKHSRVGTLFQNVYKASLIDSDEYLLEVSKYIHRNPSDIGQDFRIYAYSSYGLIERPPFWLNIGVLTKLFGNLDSLRDFTDNISENMNVVTID